MSLEDYYAVLGVKSDATLEQIVKQLNKLADVMKVQDFREGEYVDRELVLLGGAVRKVEARHVHPRGEEVLEHLLRGARGPDRAERRRL